MTRLLYLPENIRGGIVIVASITEGADWMAYSGDDFPEWDEKGISAYIAKNGHRLSEEDARHSFPEISLPYRKS